MDLIGNKFISGSMRNFITIINLAILFAITSIFSQSERLRKKAEADERVASIDNVALRQSENTPTTKSNFALWSTRWDSGEDAGEASATFLKEMVEARLMDLEQGKTASQRATYRTLKDYGSLMVKDQEKMLGELKEMAAQKNISIPTELGPEKANALNELREVHGKSFDKKFIKMMIVEHKRDVRKLETATESTDADLQVFATKYLPVVQTHLDKIKALKNAD
jgi:putative membrane protein